LAKAAGVSTESIRLAPALIALTHCAITSELLAECKLTREEEHAVSTVNVGPLKSKPKLILPDATLKVFPVAVYAVIDLTCFAIT
jgi:hypothetical protein